MPPLYKTSTGAFAIGAPPSFVTMPDTWYSVGAGSGGAVGNIESGGFGADGEDPHAHDR